jgi:hypothetical protein
MATEVVKARRVTPATERHDLWWVLPLVTVVVLVSFIIYTTWAALNNNNFFHDPYLSPFYSPCLASDCGGGLTFKIFGSWWGLSPAILILGMPAGFRLTCYYYRKAYYRSFFRAPVACAVADAPKHYEGERHFPFILQNLHRYLFFLATLVVGFLWYDAIRAFFFPGGPNIGIGTLIMLVNVVLLSLYSFSCHSCRYLAGGYLDRFFKAHVRYQMWRFVSRLNARHATFAWCSLFSVVLTDIYIRLVASGTIHDVRFF